jgi:putative transposase
MKISSIKIRSEKFYCSPSLQGFQTLGGLNVTDVLKSINKKLQKLLKPETIYHIYTHANGAENLFISEENYIYFLKKYLHYIYPVAETYAYCLMPNHFHLMIETRKEEEVLAFLRITKPTLQGFETLGGFSKIISLQFSHLLNAYTQAYNKRYNRKGSLFIPNFKRKEVAKESYATQLIVYIHNNPVHHGFVRSLWDWPYSSFQAYLTNKSSKINKRLMQEFLDNKEMLIELHKTTKPVAQLIFD